MHIEHSEFQDQLVRGLSHRMNNILTLFHGYIGLLLDNKTLDRPTLEGLAKIKEGAKAASELMDRTHSLVRQPAIVWREVRLQDFIRMLKPSFDTLRARSTKLEIDCPDEIPPIWADASRVRTAVVEVVRNALEATGHGVVKIELRVESQPPGTSAHQAIQWVSLTVSDTGAGIPAELSEKIFQPFYSTKKKQNATGLGLPVAMGCVQQLGGVMRFTSQPGKTVFQILFPSRAAEA